MNIIYTLKIDLFLREKKSWKLYPVIKKEKRINFYKKHIYLFNKILKIIPLIIS